MKSCRDCAHADDYDQGSGTVMCQCPLPAWNKIDHKSWDRVVFLNQAEHCHTYQLREE